MTSEAEQAKQQHPSHHHHHHHHPRRVFVLRRYLLLRILLRPSLWTCLISILAYWDDQALHGSYVYDDAGSLKNNPVVTGDAPWTEAATRDFWGTDMKEPQSHKSFRPLTTLSFRLNWVISEHYLGTNGTDDHTYGFHLVNVALHGINTGLVTEAAAFVFGNSDAAEATSSSLLTGLLFALHPVHAEAVSNMTSRGELLMTLFFLLAFLSFAAYLPRNNNNNNNNNNNTRNKPSIFFLYVIPWLCMTLSLFSKEQGAITLISLVIYDFLTNHSSVKEYLIKLKLRDKEAEAFLRRTLILAVQTILVAGLRYWLNGESSPDFIYDQNPAGFSEDRFTRVFSVNWVYCLYIWDALYPRYLCPDWSGLSIDLIQDKSDPRVPYVLALWAFAAGCVASLVLGLPSSTATKRQQRIRRIVLLAFFSFTFSPFLLSSNLLVVVGLMKADRVIYLPLMGFCLLESLLFESVAYRTDASEEQPLSVKDKSSIATTTATTTSCLPETRISWWGYLLVLVQLFFFSTKVHERNVAWSHSLNLWMSAYEINRKSHHTMYNCGYELSLKRRYEEAEQVLRPLADPRVDGPGNSFVYAMVLFNLDRCDEALDLIDDALDRVQELRKIGGLRNSEEKLRRNESNLYVAKAYCTRDTVEAGKWMYEAVQIDMTNRYAVEQAQEMVKKVQAAQKMMEYRMQQGI